MLLADIYGTLVQFTKPQQKGSSIMKTEVVNFVNYSAKRILDQFLSGINDLEKRRFYAQEIFKDLKDGKTREIIFDNVGEFNRLLNETIWDRINYLVEEGFVEDRGTHFHVRSEQELDVFINGEDVEENEDNCPF